VKVESWSRKRLALTMLLLVFAMSALDRILRGHDITPGLRVLAGLVGLAGLAGLALIMVLALG